MAYDHEAVDSFVKGRDNKPRFAWVIRRGVDRSRNSKLRRDTGVSGQPSAIVQRSFSPHPSSLEREGRKKGKIVSQFLPLLLVQRNAVTSLTGLGERPSSIAIAWLSRATRSKCFETTSSVSHRFYAYLIVNYVVESIPRFTGKISKWEVHLAGLGKDGLRMVNEIS